jgi:hypothetical protein
MFFAKLFRIHGAFAANHLCGKGFINFNTFYVFNAKTCFLKEFKGEPSFEEALGLQLIGLAKQAEELEDYALQAEGLQEKVASLQEQLESIPENVHVPEEITKLAQSGDFTNADLEALMKLPTETLTKVANTGSQEPWKMGKAAGMSKESADPLLEFILG